MLAWMQADARADGWREVVAPRRNLPSMQSVTKSGLQAGKMCGTDYASCSE
jgi:hypothetical protein